VFLESMDDAIYTKKGSLVSKNAFFTHPIFSCICWVLIEWCGFSKMYFTNLLHKENWMHVKSQSMSFVIQDVASEGELYKFIEWMNFEIIMIRVLQLQIHCKKFYPDCWDLGCHSDFKFQIKIINIGNTIWIANLPYIYIA